ncbi:hypothetical protein PanWU01x14_208630 [Parasponia andersonii]|uniref:Uncharacterized protein n=1 Tax=Parasponia andersonii TaxID=3476 RepID=A0A2P5BUL1_PARAD|nr:hypothetical protein PanWU01x14_208630 [Parasponia andersonii]
MTNGPLSQSSPSIKGGNSACLGQLDVGQPFFQLFNYSPGQRSTAATNDLKRTQIVAIRCSPILRNRHGRRRSQRHVADPELLDRSQHPAQIEPSFPHRHQRVTLPQCPHAVTEPVHVEVRNRTQRNRTGRPRLPNRVDPGHYRYPVTVSQLHPFDPPGGPRRVQDRGRIRLAHLNSARLTDLATRRHHGLELGRVEQNGAVPEGGDLRGGFGGGEGDDRLAELDLAGNLGRRACRIGGRDRDAEGEQGVVEDRDVDRVRGENEGGAAAGVGPDAGLERGGQGSDAARELGVGDGAARVGVDQGGGGGWRRRGVEMGEDVVGHGERRRFGRE